jgi:osmotically-inducible protein OsmY
MTRRDTYGGERGWQNGAGVSWTDPDGGGRQQWRDREPIDSDESAEGQENRGRKEGIFNDLAAKLGFRKRGPKNYERSDERIREDICERLMADHTLDVEDVEVHVEGKVVRLEGTVRVRRMKHDIEDIAANCPGVNDVENLIRVKPQPSL